MSLQTEIAKRRSFAIIAHPDAGKTTLTEKLLLFGGAIQTAGAVKAKGDVRRARSDWMKVEQARGISVTTSVMRFDYDGVSYNLLDTPGHEDFSEDTYRTLTAVDSAVMVLDAAKGIESQTLKLFEVCRLRDIPIITFVNKMDREAQDSFTLLDDIEQRLALEAVPATWPIGMGRDFKGCYDVLNDRLILMERNTTEETITCQGLDDPQIDAHLPAYQAEELREQVEMAKALCPDFSGESYRSGFQTPVYFGSAVNNFGVRELLHGLGHYAPPPRAQETETRTVRPEEDKVSGFVFKIQANMDPKHRDRLAFMRLCSGHFKKGMKLTHARLGKTVNVHNPLMFFGEQRDTAEDAFPGDIIGLPNHGNLRIGDALTEGENLKFKGIPDFAPEVLQKVRTDDPMKLKHLGKALVQLAEEGVARVFKSQFDGSWVVGVVGTLQFDVLAERLKTEYGLPVIFEATSLYTARWVRGDDSKKLKDFLDKNNASLAYDHDDDPVFLARNAWHLNDAQDKNPGIYFLAVK